MIKWIYFVTFFGWTSNEKVPISFTIRKETREEAQAYRMYELRDPQVYKVLLDSMPATPVIPPSDHIVKPFNAPK